MPRYLTEAEVERLKLKTQVDLVQKTKEKQ